MPTPDDNKPDDNKTGTQTPPTADPGGTAPKGPEGGKAESPAPITLTSEQLNARLDRARGTERNALLKDLGVESIDDLKAIIKAKQELEAANLSEREKQEKAAKDAEARAKAAEEKVAALEAERTQKERERSFKRAARAAGVNDDDLDVALLKLEKHVKTELDGAEPTKEDIETFFADLKKTKPVLFKSVETGASTSKANTKPPSSTPGGKTPTTFSLDEVMAMPANEFEAHLRRFK